jgi:hypothetical protein
MNRPDSSLVSPRGFVRLPSSHPPALLVVVDTEEEFEWGKGFFREKTSVRAMRGVPRLQKVFDSYGVRPTYVVDYPVATQRDGYGALREFQDAGAAVIGAHLHPWVNPPHEEETCARLSYPGNLTRNLEARKLAVLTSAIEETFGRRPTVYKAGRYGVGPHTAAILEELGYEIDLSICPGLDSRADGGPEFLSVPPEPYWFGSTGALLEIPCTAAFVGPLHRWGAGLRRLAATRLGEAMRLGAILARLRALECLRVSPEGFDLAQQVRVTRALLRRGVRTVSLTLHSPSATPGYTSYVPGEAELSILHDRLRGYFDFFFGEIGGVPLTPHEIRDRLARPDGAPAAAPIWRPA